MYLIIKVTRSVIKYKETMYIGWTEMKELSRRLVLETFKINLKCTTSVRNTFWEKTGETRKRL